MKQFKAFLILILFLSVALIRAHAQTADELQAKIDASTNNIKELQDEIKGYQGQIDSLGKQEDSLTNTLSSLDLSRKKLEASLAVTEDQINATTLEIEQLSLQIDDKSAHINDSERIIAQSLASIDESGSESIIESLLSANSLAEAWDTTNQLNTLQSGVKDRIHDLQSTKASLEDNKTQTESKKAQLVSLEQNLTNQKKIIADTVAEKNNLLSTTKNTESNYKKLLATKTAQEQELEREELDYESALKLVIDPASIPHTGSGVLKWPLDSIRITQYFGNTPFATANPQIYNGKGHTGVDFAASIGTPVHAALDGIVVGVGNTDLEASCYSYGKWIMIKHPNGLSTLYAHLSLQTASMGQTVATGDLIGYSGNTGYTTGPHLHFGVYATEGVVIKKFDTSINCKDVVIPLADIKAYLNPLSFL